MASCHSDWTAMGNYAALWNTECSTMDCFLQPGPVQCIGLVHLTWVWELPDGGSISLGTTGTDPSSFLFVSSVTLLQWNFTSTI